MKSRWYWELWWWLRWWWLRWWWKWYLSFVSWYKVDYIDNAQQGSYKWPRAKYFLQTRPNSVNKHFIIWPNLKMIQNTRKKRKNWKSAHSYSSARKNRTALHTPSFWKFFRSAHSGKSGSCYKVLIMYSSMVFRCFSW